MRLLGDPGGRWEGPHSGIRVSREEAGEQDSVSERRMRRCAEAPDLGGRLYSRLLPESRPLGNKKLLLIVQHYMQTAWWGTALRLALRELR